MSKNNTATITIKTNVEGNANKELQHFDRGLKGVSESSSNATKEFSKMSQGIGGLVHTYAIFAANIFAVSAAFRALSDAADYSRMITAADQLSIKTGISLTNIAKGMKDVSAGALDMKSAMQQASLGSAAGLSGNQIQALTELATKAGTALGRSVPDAINRLTLAVIKGEPELTDELGIILRLKEATEAYAATLGKTAKDLTAFERSQAVYIQAMERGNAKFGEVQIAVQPFESLLAIIKDLSTSILSLVNTALGPFVNILSESKVLLGAIAVLLLGKLAKASFSIMSEDSEKRMVRLSKYLEDFKHKTAEISKLNEMNAIDSKEGLPEVRKQKKLVSAELSAWIPTGLDKAFKKAGLSAGEAFTSAELKHFDAAIKYKEKELKRLANAGVKPTVEQKDVGLRYKGKLHQINIDEAKEIQKLKGYYKDFHEAELSFIKEEEDGKRALIAADKERQNVLRNNAKTLGASLAGHKSSFKEVNKSANALTGQLTNAGKFTKINTKATILWGYASETVARKTTAIAGIMSTISIWGAALFAIVGIFSAIGKATGLMTDNLSKYNDLLSEAKETMDKLKPIYLDKSSIDNYRSSMELLTNTITTVIDQMDKIAEASALLASSTNLDKFIRGFKNVFTLNWSELSSAAITDGLVGAYVGAIDKAKSLLSQTKEGRKELEKMSEVLEGSSVAYTVMYDDAANSLTTITDKHRELNLLANDEIRINGAISEGTKESLSMASRELTLAKKANDYAEKHKTTTAFVTTSLKEQYGITTELANAIKDSNEEQIAAILEQLKKQGELTGETQAHEVALSAVNSKWADMNAAANAVVQTLQTMSSLLSGILSKFGAVAGAANVAARASIDSKIIDLEFEKQDVIGLGKGGKKRLAEINKVLKSAEKVKKELNVQDELRINKEIRGMEIHAESVADFANKEVITHRDKTREIRRLNQKEDDFRKKASDARGRYIEAKLNDSTESVKNHLLDQARAYSNKADEVAAQAKMVGNILEREKGKKDKGGGGGGSKATPTKVFGMQAQIALEKLKATQNEMTAITDNQIVSYKARADAALELLAIEDKMHTLRLGVIAGNISDAEHNKTIAKDKNAFYKAELQLQKALTAEAAEIARQAQKTYEIRRKAHELAKAATKEGGPDVTNLGKLWAADLTYAFRDMMLEMDDIVTQLTTVTMGILDGAANSIADAIVNGTNNFAETISNVLRESASALISDSIKMLANMAISKFVIDTTTGATESAATVGAITAQTVAMATSTVTQTAALVTSGVSNTLAIVSAITSSGIASSAASIFAKGGILNHVKGYADGGVTRGAELAVIGEGKNNEAVVPLPDNRSIPVKLSGNTGGDTKVSTSIVINNNGESEVSSETQGRESKALGYAINTAIRKILVDERRNGGILT